MEPILAPADFLPGLALALAIGMLLGIERGWSMRDEEAGGRVAGIRTFGLIGLLGGLIGFELAGPLRLISLVLGGGAIAALLLGYSADMRREDNVSATSTLAGILTLGLGAMATGGHMALASVGAGAALILLASRNALHRAIALTSEADIKALLLLVLVIFVILPLLPDVGLGPFNALNPQRLWLVVVLTSGIAFVGYVLARWLGQQRGALITAIVGALVSSTAVTVNSARRIREGADGRAEDAAVAIASVMMLGRAVLLVSILAPFALASVARLVLPGLTVSILAAAVLVLRSRHQEGRFDADSVRPPGLGLAFLFALSVALISILSAWAETRFGGASAAIVIALGGIADIDAAIAAVGMLPAGSLPLRSIALALATPILFNTLFKFGLLIAIGGPRRTVPGAVALASAAMAMVLPIAFEFMR